MSEVCCNTVTVTVVNPVPVEVTAQAGTLVVVRDGTGAGDVVGPDVAADGNVVVFDGTTGRVIKDGGELGSAAFADSTDFASSAQGALADTAVQPGDLPAFGDVVTHDASEFAVVGHDHSGVYDPAGTASSAVSAHVGASDPHGDRAYADGLIAAADAMVLKGVIDCSGNPNYPAADKGWTWRVSVAGKIGGASGVTVEAGDMILCLADSTPSGTQAAVGASWGVVQTNIGALATVATSGAYADLSGRPTLGTAAATDTGTGATNTILGNDARLSDARTPTAHTHDVLSNVATGVILGRSTAGSGDSEELSASSARTVLGLGTAAQSDTGDFDAAGTADAAVTAAFARKGRYVPGNFYLLTPFTTKLGGSSAFTPGTNTMSFWRMELPEPVKIDGLWLYCQTGVASSVGRVGVWALNASTGRPTGPPLLTASASDLSSTGYKSQTFTAVELPAGVYAGGIAMSGTGAYRSWSETFPMADFGSADSVNTFIWGATAPWTYNASALPDVTAFTFTDVAGTTAPSTAPPYVRWKVATP